MRDQTVVQRRASPERALFGEVGAAVEKNVVLAADVAGYVRSSTGMIRLDPDTRVLINTGEPLDKALHSYLTFREKRG